MNRQPDPCSESLKILIEKTVYNAYCDQQPSLVETVEELLRNGQLPTQIEQWVCTKVPANSQIGNHVYLIASYLFRLQCSPN